MRRLLLAVIMAAALSPAYADQAPDTLVVTGPNFQQIPTVSLLVTIAGQQQTLGDLLSEAVFPPVTSVAGRIGAVTLTTSDIGGLGSIATQSAGAVAITGGAIDGTCIGCIKPAAGSFGPLFTAINPAPYGTYNAAVSANIQAGYPLGSPAQVNGWATPSGASAYSGRDSVALFIASSDPGTVATVSSGVTYSTTRVLFATPLTAPEIAQLQAGMLIDTSDATKYSGTITGWDTGGTYITVSGWFQQGNTTTGQIPAGATVYVNPITSIWTINAVNHLNTASHATATDGFELDTQDNSANSATNKTWGFDSNNVSGGSNSARYAFIERGNWDGAYLATSYNSGGFMFIPGAYGGTANATGAAFLSQQASGAVLRASPGGTNTTFNLDSATGAISLGGQTTSTAPYIDLHTSGGAINYDSRIIPGGGNGLTVGGGTLTYIAASHLFKGTPGVQNNNIQLTPAATSLAPSVLAIGGDANPSLNVGTAGTGQVNLVTGGGIQAQAIDTANAQNFIQFRGNIAGGGVGIGAGGVDVSIPFIFRTKGAGFTYFVSDSSSAAIQFAVGRTTNAPVNYLFTNGTVSGQPPVISAGNSADANTGLSLITKGTGALAIASGNGTQFSVVDGGALTVNYPTTQGGATGQTVKDLAAGTDAAISRVLSGKGTGIVCIAVSSDCGNEALRVTPVASQAVSVRITGAASGSSAVVGSGGGLIVQALGSSALQLGISTNAIGFYGAAGVTKQTLTGACAGNTGCVAIAAYLATLGLITNSITP